MLSVIPLDHRPSCFSKLISSQLRAFYVDTCALHAIIMDAHILLGVDTILIRRSSTAEVLTDAINRPFVVLLGLHTQL